MTCGAPSPADLPCVRAEVIKRVLGHAANANDVTAVYYLWHNYYAEALEAVES